MGTSNLKIPPKNPSSFDNNPPPPSSFSLAERRSDLWKIYCCDMPYPNLSFADISSAVVRQNLRPDILRCCPSGMANIMKRCWDANPNKRLDCAATRCGLDGAVTRCGLDSAVTLCREGWTARATDLDEWRQRCRGSTDPRKERGMAATTGSMIEKKNQKRGRRLTEKEERVEKGVRIGLR
ncbi:hypothetical protein HN873_048849 [Arachis hypogaea]